MIFGRDKLIQQIWKILEKDSILFTGERRTGKTTVLEALDKAPKSGFKIIKSDVEKINSSIGFVDDILNNCRHLQKTTDKTQNWFSSLQNKVGGVEIAGIIKIPETQAKDWNALLQASLKGICENSDDKIVFVWDEIPYMLQKINHQEIAENSHQKSSLQILDTLRALRQELPNLRMIFTGSIGLHHVINEITEQRYATEPINDMEKVNLERLDLKSAHKMAKHHLVAEQIEKVTQSTIKKIAKECDYIPFYIEKLIRILAIKETKITPKMIDIEIQLILIHADDRWELEHFRSRLNIYYQGEINDVNQQAIKKSAIAKSILNHCAMASIPQSVDDCYQAVKARFAIEDRDLIIELLLLLVKDYYLEKNIAGTYCFYFTLVQRWWILAEGLNDA